MIIIPVLSFLGFSCFFSKYFKIKLNHAIPITISILVTILYCCAILNLLMAATYLLYFIGILLVYSFYLKNRHRFSYESLFFTLVSLLFFSTPEKHHCMLMMISLIGEYLLNNYYIQEFLKTKPRLPLLFLRMHIIQEVPLFIITLC